MAYDPATVAAVRQRYLSGDTPEKIAAALGIPLATINRWRKAARDKNDDWDKLKSAYAIKDGDLEGISRDILLMGMAEHRAMAEEIRNSTLPIAEKVTLYNKMSDGYNKFTASSRRVLPETLRLATGLEVLDELAKYISQHKPALLADFVGILEPFGKRLPGLLEAAK